MIKEINDVEVGYILDSSDNSAVIARCNLYWRQLFNTTPDYLCEIVYLISITFQLLQ